ncbi:MAG: endonuclease/exonuclease/phosphatase family protein, partial [Gaiellales bacterium]
THFRDRLAEAELDRAEQALRHVPGNVPRVLCGDFNLSPDRSPAFARLARSGWSLPTAGIDHVLGLRLVPTGPAQAWPVERRRSGQTVLSDHAPVDAELTVG